MVELVVAVDPDGTGLEGVADADGSAKVLGVHSGGETVGGVVTESDDVGLILKLSNGTDGAENLLLHDLHVVGDVGEDSGLDEVSLVTVALTTNLDSGTLLLTGLDVAHDTVVLKLADLRTLEGLLVEWVTNLVGLSTLLESLEELVVDFLLHEDAGTSTAALAVVVIDTKVDPLDSGIDIGVLEDDVGRLATELEGDLLEVGRSSGLHNGATDQGGASESNLVNIHVRGNSSTSDLSETVDQVEDACGETSLLDELGHDKSGQRGLLSSLHDEGVTGGESRANLPCEHEKREVPWDDLTANTNLSEHVSTSLNSDTASVDYLRVPGECSASCWGQCR